MKTILFLLLSLALFSCQGGHKQDVKSTEETKHQIVDTASVYYINPLPLYFILGGDTVYTLVDGGLVFPIHTSAPDDPDLFIDLNNYVKKKVANAHLGKGSVDLVFIIDKEGYVRDVTVEKSAKESGANPNVAARMDSIACKVIANLPRFTAPATRKGKSVNFLKRWTVRFE